MLSVFGQLSVLERDDSTAGLSGCIGIDKGRAAKSDGFPDLVEIAWQGLHHVEDSVGVDFPFCGDNNLEAMTKSHD
jgi:hypothetical protein